jgi:signal transduction histidine kinase
LLRSERLAALGEMAARVAHDFRTPLTVIGGFARSMLERSLSDAPDRDTLRIVADEVRRLEDMVSSVLEHAKEPRPDVRSVDVGRVAGEAVEFLRYEFDARGILSELDVRPGTPHVQVDRDRLFQALINLMHNSVHAMPAGGPLRVDVRAVAHTVEIEVRDEGVGIQEQDLPNVFEPFYTTRTDGTGLGLSIVARIARDHGGDVRIASREGHGTSVVLSIPTARPGGAGRSRPTYPTPDPGVPGPERGE